MKKVPAALASDQNSLGVCIDGDNAIIYKEISQPFESKRIYATAASLGLVLGGRKIVKDFEGHETIVEKGQMVFLPRDVFFISDLVPSAKPFTSYLFFFDANLLAEHCARNPLRLVKGQPQKNQKRLVVLDIKNSLHLFCSNLSALFQSVDRGRHRLLALKLNELLQLIHIDYGEEFDFSSWALGEQAPRIRNMTEFMHEFYDTSLSVQDYITLTGRSKSTFNREFKKEFGISAKQWLIERKLNRAEEMLRTGQNDVTRLAFELGYENVSQFIRLFKRKFGLSPGQYEKKARQA